MLMVDCVADQEVSVETGVRHAIGGVREVSAPIWAVTKVSLTLLPAGLLLLPA